MKSARKITRIGIAALAIVWFLLYLPHLRTCPGWYGDETLIHHTSRNLASGKATNFALWATFWHPHYPYQPAYTLVNGLFAHTFGGDLIGTRFFNALIGLAAALAMFLLGKRSFGAIPAFFAAAMFLTYEQTIIHYRMSYAHNAAGLGLLLMALFLLRRAGPRNDWCAGLGLLIAAGSHPLFIHGAFSGSLCRLLRPRSWYRLLLPSAIYLVISMSLIWLAFGNWLFEDLAHLKWTYLSRGESDGSGGQSLYNLTYFIGQDWFHALMVCGLLLCLPLRRYAVTVVGLLVLFLLVRNRQNLVPFYYQAVVILPVLCIGWAGLLRFAILKLRRYQHRVTPLVWIVLAIPAAQFASKLPKSLMGTYTPRNFYWVTQSTDEVQAAAEWLNRHTKPGDVVGGNPNIAWLLHAETVPYLQMITWYGLPTQGYENGNARERFRFDASLENCRYAVLGDIDQRWALHEPNVGQLAERMTNEGWQIVWRGPHYLILENPRLKISPQSQ